MRLPRTPLTNPYISLCIAVLLTACPAEEDSSSAPTFALSGSGCIDEDGDGFGRGCVEGDDCDDGDAAVHEGCLRCLRPNEGCPCDDAAPQTCSPGNTIGPNGTLMCNEGTRYCREGRWSACESIQSYAAPSGGSLGALLDPNTGAMQCNDCSVGCYLCADDLDPVEDGLDASNSSSMAWVQGGGLTLETVEGVVTIPPTVPHDISECIVGTAPDQDCDGIDDELDPYPGEKPFATANPTLVLDVPAGASRTGVVDLAFHLNSADVYFLVDQSGSMQEERDRLIADLTSGDFIEDAAYDCADADFDGTPDNERKDQGIVGAVRCMIRDANFGAGLFREIPFSPYGPGDHVAFEHHQDITADVDSVLDAFGSFQPIANQDWPEASMVALHSVVTGAGMDFGLGKHSVSARTDCDEEHWGYPCFRDGAIPIVLLFTDAQMHNGPEDNDYAYDPDRLDISVPPDSQAVGTDHESFETALDLGDLTDSLVSLEGDTTTMSADAAASCGGGDSPDAVFRFELTAPRTVSFSTSASELDAVLALWNGVPGTGGATPTSIVADNANESEATALDLGALDGADLTVTGSTQHMHDDVSKHDAGCGAQSQANDAVFRFELAARRTLRIEAEDGFDAVVSLFEDEVDDRDRIACDSKGAWWQDSSIERTLDAGTYYIVVKGKKKHDEGAYTLRVTDTGAVAASEIACEQGSFERALQAGTYYLVMAGEGAGEAGPYQVTLGGGQPTSSHYVPPTWTQTRDALVERGVHVLPVLSCHDDPFHGDGDDCDEARAQAISLANATDTLGSALEPLVLDIDRDGSGLSRTVVDGIASLASHLEMDVSIRIAFEPDANPGFEVQVQAVDEVGDGCTGVVGIEHQQCVPGATPRFHLTFTNPEGAPVPLNPEDPNGGYNFRAELIANGRFLVDAIPVYVIPEDVGAPAPAQAVHRSEGSYWQDIEALGCKGNQRPDWRDLSWTATVPAGTELGFQACTADTVEGLDVCEPTNIAKVKGTSSCTSDDECGLGFCGANGVCQMVTVGECLGNAQCPDNAVCDEGTCVFESQPVYVGAALGPGNFLTQLRMQVDMTANATGSAAPTLYDWSLTYFCTNVL